MRPALQQRRRSSAVASAACVALACRNAASGGLVARQRRPCEVRGRRAGAQVSGDLGGEMAQHADKLVSGFIRTFERNYSRFEQAVKQAVRGPSPPARAAGRPSCRVQRVAR
jgi:hypothetical protein